MPSRCKRLAVIRALEFAEGRWIDVWRSTFHLVLNTYIPEHDTSYKAGEILLKVRLDSARIWNNRTVDSSCSEVRALEEHNPFGLTRRQVRRALKSAWRNTYVTLEGSIEGRLRLIAKGKCDFRH